MTSTMLSSVNYKKRLSYPDTHSSFFPSFLTLLGCVLQGLRQKVSEFDIAGGVCKLVKTVGVFITMNPGYAGRTELPENLKVRIAPQCDAIPRCALYVLQRHVISRCFA
jgi:hypothetical protein